MRQAFVKALPEKLEPAVSIGRKEDGPAVPRPSAGCAAEAPIVEGQAAGRSEAAAIVAQLAHVDINPEPAFQEHQALSVRGERQAIRIEIRPLLQPHGRADCITLAKFCRNGPDAVLVVDSRPVAYCYFKIYRGLADLVVLVPHTAVVETLPGPSKAVEGIVKAVPRRMLLLATSLNVGLVETITCFL